MRSRSHQFWRALSDTSELCAEALEERTVLSASPSIAAPATVFEVERLDEAKPLVANSAPVGADGQAFMQGTNYSFSPDDFPFSDPFDTPPDNFDGIRLASLPAQGFLTAYGSGVAVGQIIPVEDVLAGELAYSTSGVEAIPYAVFTFQVVDDGSLADGGANIDPTPNTFTLLYDDERVDFVRNLYQDILQRSPEAAGITHWLDQLVDGVSTQQVASDLWRSFEHRSIQVDGYYERFFERDPDPAGRAFWINQMLAGLDESAVIAAFLSTEEYRLNNPTSDQFLTAAYSDLFGRTPDTIGFNFWLDQLNSGQLTREMVATQLATTRERYLNLLFEYYDDFYSRLPDSAGLEFWVNQLTNNLLDSTEVAAALLSTPEYLNQPV